MTKKFMVEKFKNATGYMQVVEQQGEKRQVIISEEMTDEEFERKLFARFDIEMSCGPYGDEG